MICSDSVTIKEYGEQDNYLGEKKELILGAFENTNIKTVLNSAYGGVYFQ